MAKQNFLELARVDVLAPANDHVLQPSLDRAIAPCIHRTEVAGVQPSFRVDRRPGGSLVLEISMHDVIAARAYFTDLADRDRLSCARIDDLDLDIGHRRADRP